MLLNTVGKKLILVASSKCIIASVCCIVYIMQLNNVACFAQATKEKFKTQCIFNSTLLYSE